VHWSAYEVFSILSGIVLIGLAFTPDEKASNRFWCGIGGIGFIAYAFYVAAQTSGTFYFPVWIFVVPVIGAIRAAMLLTSSNAHRAGTAETRGEE
jgi:hypothetical protein